MASSEYAQLVEFLGERFTAVDQRFTVIEGRFDALERQVAGLRQEMLGHFDEGYRRLERLEQEYHAITQSPAWASSPWGILLIDHVIRPQQ